MKEKNTAAKGLLAVLIMILCAVLIFSNLKPSDQKQTEDSVTPQSPYSIRNMKGVWINYLEFGEMIRGKSLEQYRENVENCLKNVTSLGLDTVVLHVRSHCDAFYESNIFPYSYQLSGNQGEGCGFDPLNEFVRLAHEKNIRVEAWINPYRVTSGSDLLESLDPNNPARNFDAQKQELISLETGTFLNPSCQKSSELIVSGVREILDKYPVDGIHFDDYFYPSSDESIDSLIYENYCGQTIEPKSLGDFRREMVNLMIKSVYDEVKKHEGVAFGISPAADVEKNRNVLFADVESWCKGGFCDYICPQIYFGFEYPTEGFDFLSICKKWQELCQTNVNLNIGIGAYKIGKTDASSEEWKTYDDILKRQAIYAKEIGAGVCFYNYSALFSNDGLNTAQRENLKNSCF